MPRTASRACTEGRRLAEAPPLSAAERRLYRLGVKSFERGDDEAALAHLTELARTRDGFADVHYMLGVLHERSASGMRSRLSPG